jgi:hypothetical protein
MFANLVSPAASQKISPRQSGQAKNRIDSEHSLLTECTQLTVVEISQILMRRL